VVFVYNFNPFASLPDLNKLRNAVFNKDIFIVVHDLFLNETTKYADLVIPAKFDLESYDIYSPYYYPSISINIAGSCPYKDCYSNYELFQMLANKMGIFQGEFSKKTEKEIFHDCLNLLPEKIKLGVLNNGYSPNFNEDEVPFEDLIFPTSSGKIRIPPDFFVTKDNIQAIFGSLKDDELVLLTPSHPLFLHSQLGLVYGEHLEDFNKIFLNPDDMLINGIRTSEIVMVSNEFGFGKYQAEPLNTLKKSAAIIYSGMESPENPQYNANIFVPDVPERMGGSGSYNLSKVKISKI
jgi:anaerobic selenocysteine-containing dehydrogenase